MSEFKSQYFLCCCKLSGVCKHGAPAKENVFVSPIETPGFRRRLRVKGYS